MLVLIGLYWVKVKIDTSLGSINKKQAKQLKRIIVDAIVEGHQQAHREKNGSN
tara:strand:+ start:142 stop:300 length:159 start_codon:yes stop_codon:yes gene_type:complete